MGQKMTEPTEPFVGEGFRRLASARASSRTGDQMTLRGFDTYDESPTNPSTSATPSAPAAQNPAHSPEVDPLTAFVASLSAEQKAKLAALLLGGKPSG